MNQRGFVIPPFLLSPTGIMATVIVVLSLSNVIFFKLYRGTADEYSQFKVDVSAQQVATQRDNERKQADAERAVLDASLSWQRALDYSRRNPVVRVLQPHCDSGTSAQVTGTGLKPDAPTSEPGLSATRDVAFEECESRLNKAVIDAAQVIHLQYDRENLCRIYGCQ